MNQVQDVLLQAYRFAVPDIDTATAQDAIGHLLHHDMQVTSAVDAVNKLDVAAEKCLFEQGDTVMHRVLLYWNMYRRCGQLIEYLPIERCMQLYKEYPNETRYMARDPLTYPMLTLDEASLIVPEAPVIEVELATDIRNMLRNVDSVYDPPSYQPLDEKLKNRFRIEQKSNGSIYLKV